MQKMTGQTADIAAENAAKIRELFPDCFDPQGNINFPALKTKLGVPVDSDKDSAANYSFVWSGKEKGRAYALAPSAGTLRPDRSKSVDFDTTKNLYIEGDNLEVLKLLRGSYAGRVKMIYIDPPYNTGNDFVYNDDYSDSIESYKKLVGIVADDGTKLKTNADTAGRYHTNWLNMMFPRLLLARDLLSDDGVIFISIDDNEVANLKKICDEVFGESNFVANFLWKKKGTTSNVEGAEVSSLTDSTLCYRKTPSAKITPRIKSKESRVYPERDEEGNYRLSIIEKKDAGGYKRESMKFEILGHKPREGKRWQIGIEKAKELEAKNRFIFDGEKIQLKIYDFEDKDTTSAWPNLLDDCGSSDSASQMVNNDLFGVPELFDNPKPIELIERFLSIASTPGSVILDFFSGSATTAHAVLQMNANVHTEVNRKFIMVQLQEPCPEDSEAAKAGFKNVCEIGEERIRRAVAKIKAEHPDFKGDLGFKVFTLDSSNVIPWNPDPSKLDLTMRDMEKNLVAGRENEDLLFEILLKKNVPLDVDIESFEVETEENGAKTKNTVYVAGGVLFVCLDQHIPGEVSSEILKLRDKLAPETDIQVVFRETGFCDVDKTNALAILEQGGVDGGQIWTL